MIGFILQSLCYKYKGNKQEDNHQYDDIRSIKHLRFNKDQRAQSLRGTGQPQLQPQHYSFEPSYIECQNLRHKQSYPKWLCTASGSELKLVDYTIECVSKKEASEFIVLRDSCSIKYDIILTEQKKYQQNYQQPNYQDYYQKQQKKQQFYENGYFSRNKQLQPIDLADISILVFEKNQKTTSRKSQFFDQLQSKSGNTYKPDEVVCRNLGINGNGKTLWNCKVHELEYPKELKEAHVSCEGWNGPGDSLIVPGSCLLEYRIGDVDSDELHIFQIVALLLIIAVVIVICIKTKYLCSEHDGHYHRGYNPFYNTNYRNNYYHQPHYNNHKEKEDKKDKDDRQSAIASTSTR